MNQTKTNYLPKDQRKKLLFIGDDLRFHSGIGTIMRAIVLGTADHFNYISIGSGINHPDMGKRLDLSLDTNNILGIDDSSVILYPFNGYGSQEFIRELIRMERPDGILFITDPRYYEHLFRMEHEIRTQNIPLIYLNIWDDEMPPLYNKSFYRSCDGLLCISRQTESLVKRVLGEYKKDKHISYVPHGIDPKQFFPIETNTEEEKQLQEVKTHLFNGKDYEFVVLFNSRNIRRKQIPDTLLSFKTFLDKLPEDKKDKCCIVLHTQPVDDNGTDLYAVTEMLFGPRKDQVIFSSHMAPVVYMNALYNLADVTILISSNEGWGLSLTESLMAGTMVIGNVTGGIQDQARFEDENGNWIEFNDSFSSNHLGRYRKCGRWFLPVFPSNISIQGSVPTPYIFDDRVDFRDVSAQIMQVYQMSKEERKERGLAGRTWVTSDESGMSAPAMCQRMIDSIDIILNKNVNYREKWNLLKVTDRPLKYLENPVSY